MRIGLISLGCPKNLVDSEVMLGLAREAGHELTTDAASADAIIVNTCAFIDKAKQESINTILEMAQLKHTGACSRLIVTGCLAERYRDELREQIPEIDAVLGTGDVLAITRALAGEVGVGTSAGTGEAAAESSRRAGLGSSAQPGAAAPARLFKRSAAGTVAAVTTRPSSRHREAAATRALPTYLYDANTPRVLTTPRHFAYVKIAEGCDYNCAFCIIPTLRGQYRSRAADSIVAEVEGLVAQGVKEVVLISQDTTFYGVDQRERGALGRLLRRLNDIEGLAWIRLLYLYPTTVTADTLDAMAECEKVCRYVDMPLQHASDALLKRMRRPGSRASYTRLLNMMRERMPDVTLRTTFITGFPGETDDDVEALLGFVKEIEFDHVGVFTYSHEEGTAAAALVDDVPAAVKRRRQAKVMRAQRRIVERRQRRRVGQRVQVMVDGPSSEHELVWQGRLAGQAPDIDPVVYLSDCDVSDLSPGVFLEGEVIDARGYDLVVRPLPGNLPA